VLEEVAAGEAAGVEAERDEGGAEGGGEPELPVGGPDQGGDLVQDAETRVGRDGRLLFRPDFPGRTRDPEVQQVLLTELGVLLGGGRRKDSDR
jgi:hypothetical protein